jgi:glycosyltransferase involved in cell wall biosynthesis
MDWTSQCAVVIPCLNEGLFVEDLVREVRRYLPTVIVVDDGSSDSTGLLAARGGAEVIRHDRPQGKGAALQSGLRQVRDRGYSWVMTLDGDGQHAPEDIPKFLRCAEAAGVQLVIGNRMDQPGQMPWLRRQVNRVMSRRLSKIAGQWLPDTQCGFRLLKLEPWAQLTFQTRHFEVESEVLLEFIAAGHQVAFVPIRVIYKAEQSKIHPVRDTLRWFHWLRTRRKKQSH